MTVELGTFYNYIKNNTSDNITRFKITFSDKIDEPIQNIESLVERTQNNRQELLKQFDTKPIINTTVSNTIIGSSTEFNPTTEFTTTAQFTPINEITPTSAQVIKTQNNILIKILETQHKILEALQNKK